MKSYWVYILANRPRGTLYVGVTSNLIRRVYEHREGLVEGFTKEYSTKMLVYYEQHATAMAAIQRAGIRYIAVSRQRWEGEPFRGDSPGWGVRQIGSTRDLVLLEVE